MEIVKQNNSLFYFAMKFWNKSCELVVHVLVRVERIFQVVVIQFTCSLRNYNLI